MARHIKVTLDNGSHIYNGPVEQFDFRTMAPTAGRWEYRDVKSPSEVAAEFFRAEDRSSAACVLMTLARGSNSGDKLNRIKAVREFIATFGNQYMGLKEAKEFVEDNA